jgi:hypothetical protein
VSHCALIRSCPPQTFADQMRSKGPRRYTPLAVTKPKRICANGTARSHKVAAAQSSQRPAHSSRWHAVATRPKQPQPAAKSPRGAWSDPNHLLILTLLRGVPSLILNFLLPWTPSSRESHATRPHRPKLHLLAHTGPASTCWSYAFARSSSIPFRTIDGMCQPSCY